MTIFAHPRRRAAEDIREAEVAEACDEYARGGGWIVERYEQQRASRICTGIPDRRYVHRGRGLRIWVELKRPGGQLTQDQHQWLVDEHASDGLATCIDDRAQLEMLCTILARPRVGRLEAARAYCAELVRLAAQRGYRREGL